MYKLQSKMKILFCIRTAHKRAPKHSVCNEVVFNTVKDFYIYSEILILIKLSGPYNIHLFYAFDIFL